MGPIDLIVQAPQAEKMTTSAIEDDLSVVGSHEPAVGLRSTQACIASLNNSLKEIIWLKKVLR
jgi:hypothetical protein